MLSAAPASANTISTLSAASWAYIDSAAPRTSFVNPSGDMPVGAFTYANGVNHVSKSYVTFNLSALRGNRFISAFFGADETAVADCANPRSTQAWLTSPAAKPTWNNQPAELVRLGGPFLDSSCPARNVTWNATAAVQSALDAGRSTATIALRLPDDEQNDPRFARQYSPTVRLTVTYNRAPGKPSQLTVNDKPCTSNPVPVGPGSARVAAAVVDPDDTFIGAEFALWPADHPEQRVTFSNGGSQVGDVYWAFVDPYLTNGVTYAWQVRGRDSLDTGPWSAVCRFATDFTPPATTPAVTSSDYSADAPPGSGGTGIPGLFTFSANGDRDVVGFKYGEFEAHTFVAADRPGGKASIRYVPTNSGPLSLAVRGVDAAGNVSPTTQYRFWVASNEPDITCDPKDGFVGEPRQCTFSPRGNGVVTGYVYRVDNQPELSVAAGPDGIATVTVIPDNPAQFVSRISVRARLTSGYLTGDSSDFVFADPGTPTIDAPADQVIIGAPVRFTVHAVLPGSVSVTYHWRDLENTAEPVTVPLDADGTATITVTPTRSGSLWFNARTTTEAGYRSGWGEAFVHVASNQPRVTSAEYPEFENSGGVGVPGTFVFSSPVPGVVSYTYSFNGQPATTVPAGADGTAIIVFTPTEIYGNSLTVTSTLANGAASESRLYSFFVASTAPGVLCDDDDGVLRPGQTVRCSLRPVQAGVVAYGYAVDSGPEHTVPAGADGTATIDFTVPADQLSGTFIELRVWSVNGTGTRTDETVNSFFVSRLRSERTG